MRVLFADHTAQPSGGQLALWRLISNLPPEIEAVISLPRDGPLYDAYLQAPSVDVHEWAIGERAGLARGRGVPSARGVVALVRATAHARRVIREVGPDVVHANSMKSALAFGVPARLARRTLVIHVRDRLARGYMSLPQLTISRVAVWLLPSGVVANSTSTLSLISHRRTTRTQVLPSPCATCVGAQRRRDDEVLKLVTLCRLVRWKGLDVLLRALGQLSDAGVDGFRLTIYGAPLLDDDGYEAELRGMVSAMGLGGLVEFGGHVDDIERALLDCDVLVQPSVLPEPFGQAVVEGMSCGLAVVASDAGGPAENIEHGVTGLLTTPGDAEALASTIQQLIEDPLMVQRIGENARDAVARFRPAPVVTALGAFYRSLDSSASTRRPQR